MLTIEESRTTMSCEIAKTKRVRQRSLKIISGATVFKVLSVFIGLRAVSVANAIEASFMPDFQ